jgi:hypothetical protein
MRFRKRENQWPEGKSFAFTIIDDTDNSTINNTKCIYELLHSCGLKTTKTVWVYKPRDSFVGDYLLQSEYLSYVKWLRSLGFEIQLHNVGSGSFERCEIIRGFEEFNNLLGNYPSMHINHSVNPDNIYWGNKRFGSFLRFFLNVFFRQKMYYGDEIKSIFFWGDVCRKRIKYIRNRVFLNVNTLKCDPKMPFIEKKKVYSNLWFSSSDGHSITLFNDLTSERNINKLIKEGGCCIVYTHFASGFLNDDGTLNANFVKNIEYLSKQNGWFVPATQLLDYLALMKDENSSEPVSQLYLNFLDLRWLLERLFKKVKYKI